MASMSRKPAPIGALLLGMSMSAGGLASTALAGILIHGKVQLDLLPVMIGAVFAGLGWLFTETIVESIVFLVITAVMGFIALTYIESTILRIMIIAFVCGFNIGKIGGGINKEFR